MKSNQSKKSWPPQRQNGYSKPQQCPECQNQKPKICAFCPSLRPSAQQGMLWACLLRQAEKQVGWPPHWRPPTPMQSLTVPTLALHSPRPDSVALLHCSCRQSGLDYRRNSSMLTTSNVRPNSVNSAAISVTLEGLQVIPTTVPVVSNRGLM